MGFLLIIVVIGGLILLRSSASNMLNASAKLARFGNNLKKLNLTDKEVYYHKTKYFLTDAERNFYFILKPIADNNNLIIFSKVRLLDLFYVPKYDQSSRGRIIQKHVDFVLCEPEHINPVCAIELDDSSHEKESRQVRDDFVNEVFNSADLPLLRIKTAYNYNAKELESKIMDSVA